MNLLHKLIARISKFIFMEKMSDDSLEELQNEDGNKTSAPEGSAGKPQNFPSNSTEASESIQNNFEINLKVNEVFEWIEAKIALLKVLQGNDESGTNATENSEKDSSKEDQSSTLEEMLDEIDRITFKETTEPNCISEEVSKMLDMLQETTIGLLDNLNLSEKRCRSIKVLATLIRHLSASVGTKVTHEDIQKHINGQKVLDMYSEVENSREPVLAKMATSKKYIEHGITRTQHIAKKCVRHRNEVDSLYSEFSSSADLQSVNEKLKKMSKESANLLIKYSDSMSYLVSKTKDFISLKQDAERLLGSFMTKEIPDLYKT